MTYQGPIKMSNTGIRLGFIVLCLQFFTPSFTPLSASTGRFPQNTQDPAWNTDLKQAFKTAGYIGRPTALKMVGSVIAFAGPIAVMMYANKLLKRDKEARQFKLREKQQQQFNPMMMLQQQMQMLQQGEGGQGMMFPGMEEQPTEQNEQEEQLVETAEQEVQAEEAAAQAEALEGEQTRQPMVLEPLTEEQPSEQSVNADAAVAKQQPVKKPAYTEKDFLTKSERIFWSIASWVAAGVAIVGGFELFMTTRRLIKGNSVPPCLRDQINGYNELCDAQDSVVEEIRKVAGNRDPGNLTGDQRTAYLIDLSSRMTEIAKRYNCHLAAPLGIVEEGTLPTAQNFYGHIKSSYNAEMRAGLNAVKARDRESRTAKIFKGCGYSETAALWTGASQFTPTEILGIKIVKAISS